jgi:hypothetical protein
MAAPGQTHRFERAPGMYAMPPIATELLRYRNRREGANERSFRCLTQIKGSVREFSLYCKASSEAEAQRLDAILRVQDHVWIQGSKAMESATFRKWLTEHGCRFDRHGHEKRGEGQVIVTVHREGLRPKGGGPSWRFTPDSRLPGGAPGL